jgi:hypothetical protein
MQEAETGSQDELTFIKIKDSVNPKLTHSCESNINHSKEDSSFDLFTS